MSWNTRIALNQKAGIEESRDVLFESDLTVEGTIFNPSGIPIGHTENIEEILTNGNNAGTLGISNLGDVGITSTSTSTSSSTGALIVAGGVGVGENLNVAGSVEIADNMWVEGGLKTGVGLSNPSGWASSVLMGDDSGAYLIEGNSSDPAYNPAIGLYSSQPLSQRDIYFWGGLDAGKQKTTDWEEWSMKIGESIECNRNIVIGSICTINNVSIDNGATGYRINNNSFFNTDVGGNGRINTQTITLTNVGGSSSTLGEETVMTKFRLLGTNIGTEKYFVMEPYNGGAVVARGRIAMDKAYFATAQHPVRIPLNYDESYYGLILSSKGEYINKPVVSEAHVYCELTTEENDKNVYGIYSNYDFVISNPDESNMNIYNQFIPQVTTTSKIGYVNGGGEGQIWASNINGNIEKGDFICSSSICGIGKKQDDDLKHNYTIFKSAFDCDFTDQVSTYPRYIHDESYTKKWVDDNDHSLGFQYESVNYTNQVYDLNVYADRYEIVGKLTYYYDFQTNKPDLVGQSYKAMLIGGTYQN